MARRWLPGILGGMIDAVLEHPWGSSFVLRLRSCALISAALVLGALLIASDAGAAKKGAVLVKDINRGKGGSTGGEPVRTFASVSGTLFFAADDRKHGVELWRSDGTRKGTRMVKDIRPGARPCAGTKRGCRGQGASSYPFELTAVGKALYFTADDGIHGVEVWRSNGTSRGTRMVKDVIPGSAPTDNGPGGLTNVAGTLFFTSMEGSHTGLWRSDGSAAGTTLVKDLQGVAFPVAVGHLLLFAAADGAHAGLWRSDGTPSGTVPVKEFLGGGCGVIGPCHLTNVAGSLFFMGSDAAHTGLWRSDGTEAGTLLVEEGVGGYDLEPVGRTLYFATFSESDSWLWRSDGTGPGTVPVISIGPTPEGCGCGLEITGFPELTNVSGTLFFFGAGGLSRTDGTASGTRLLRSGTLADQLTAAGKTLYFQGSDKKHGNELWQSDGTRKGTRLVRDIKRGGHNANISELTAVGKTLFFSASDGKHGNELWRAGPALKEG
jgi:ELWxxDGT repeat protein